MSKSLNISSLFYTETDKSSLWRNITLSKKDSEELATARRSIREHIRSKFKVKLFEVTRGDNTSGFGSPKFFTQGSWAYKTINSPEYPPRQQADLDDGIYFPLSYIDHGPPKQASQILIKVVDLMLKELAEQNEWSLKTDNPNCSRLIIAPDKHIDVPIYCMPDQEFIAMTEARARDLNILTENLDEQLIDDHWELMPEGVLMAHRHKGWIESDPRPVKDWVECQVSRKGEQLRRIMRYIKAWRDHQPWKVDDPKSILLMSAVDLAFERKIDRRDDLALLDTVSKLSQILKGKIPSPADKNNDLSIHLDEKGIRKEVISKFERLHDNIKFAMNRCGDPNEACKKIIDEFGKRFPNDAKRIAIDTVQNQPAKKVASVAPIGTLTSG